MPRDLMTVQEAAAHLGVSRRRAQALVQSGSLPAERIGTRWVISAASLRETERNRWREAGRPMSQAAAWRIITTELGSKNVTGPALDRLRRRLRSRATHTNLFVHPSQLQRVLESPDVILGGRAAAQRTGAPIDESGVFDAYVRDSRADTFIRRTAARHVTENANLVLHAIDDSAWPFASKQRHVSSWIAWLDLADNDDRAADTLLDRLVGGRARD